MSKILASIADAERHAAESCALATSYSKTVIATATAARAEHAEIVAFVQRVSREDQNADEHNAARILDMLGREARALLSRVGGGA